MNIESVFAKAGGAYLTAQGSILDASTPTSRRSRRTRSSWSPEGRSARSALPASRITSTSTGEQRHHHRHRRSEHLAGRDGGEHEHPQHPLAQRDVDLKAQLFLLDAVDLLDPRDPNSGDDPAATTSRPRADVLGHNITLTSVLGGIGLSGNDLDIDSDGLVTASSGLANVYLIETSGDLVLKTRSGPATATPRSSPRRWAASSTATRRRAARTSPRAARGCTPRTTSGRRPGPCSRRLATSRASPRRAAPGSSTRGHSKSAASPSSPSAASGLEAGGDIILGAMSPITVTDDAVSTNGAIVISAIDDRENGGDFITVKSGHTIWSKTSSVKFFAGDDLTIESGAIVRAATFIDIRIDSQADAQGNLPAPGYLNADPRRRAWRTSTARSMPRRSTSTARRTTTPSTSRSPTPPTPSPATSGSSARGGTTP